MTTNKWANVPSIEIIEKTIANLKANGINAVLANNAHDAKEKALALIPEHAEVMTQTSVTTEHLNLATEINETRRFNSVRKTLMSMNRATQNLEMQKLGAAPVYTVGSVHAVTEDGKVVIASNTGSQLPSYVYGSSHVIWIAGAQKIVKNLDAAMKRIYEYVLPLESERARKAYGVDGSFVSKLLIINREVNPERAHLIIIPEALGF